MYRRTLMGILVFACSLPASAAEPVAPEQLRQDFNRRYQDYLRPDSQALLPFAAIDKAQCQQLITGGRLQQVYSEPGVAYNAKVYTFTLYRDGEHYYLDAKGGFWGMDQLCYGPIAERELR